jgi:glutaryl-CoA dehydrogenase (non-decarboxylating)
MNSDLTESQLAVRSRIRDFAKTHIEPVANEIDTAQVTPAFVIMAMAENGWLGAALPTDWGIRWNTAW